MLSLILLHFAGACSAPLLVRWLGSRAFLVLALAPAAAAGWALSQYGDTAAGKVTVQQWPWIPDLGVELAFRCDALALLMVLVVGSVGSLVLVYCAGYFSWAEFGLGQFAGTLTAFAGAMLGLVLADDLIVLYVMWELTTVFSYLLIGHVPERRRNRLAALQALIVTTLGGLAMLVGFLMLGQEAGTYSISGIIGRPPPVNGSVTVALVLVLAGALSKSALWPFSLWLPGAMAAPTPVSAYLHAAAMVKAGVYLVARLAPAYSDALPWRVTVLTLGSVTMLLGGWRALRETDLKLLLAYGTISQLGLLFVLFGTGTYDAALAGTAVLVAHALFKAPLFLVVGIIDHAAGTRELNRLSGLARSMPVVCAVAVLAAASMAALPPVIGFAAKEAALTSLLRGGNAQLWTLAAVVAASALTTAYTLRFVWGAFATKPAGPPGSGQEELVVREVAKQASPIATPLRGSSGPLLVAPAALCSLAGLALGPGITGLDPLLARYAGSFAAPGPAFRLELWHGFGPGLGLSVLSWLAGGLLFLAMRPLGRLGERLSVVEGPQVFARALWFLERASLEVTGAVQRGSLPVYLGTVLAVLIAAQSSAMIIDPPWARVGPVRWFDSGPQLGVVVIICAVAVLCVMSRQRVTAVVLAGVTGYGTAVLYVLHGAPDLALTQFAVETLSLVVFVLVLRRLPARFPSWSRTSTPRRVSQSVTGLAAGAFAAVLTYVAGAARLDAPAGSGLIAATEEDGLKNIVSTTLVDLRSWDTMGESAVLAVAAVGVTSLVYLRRRAGSAVEAGSTAATAGSGAEHPYLPVGPPADGGYGGRRSGGPDWSVLGQDGTGTPQAVGATPRRIWLAASGTLDPERRSVIFEVLARLVFHPIVVLSLFLLFCAENLPGGGFTAGLVAGLALAVRYLAGGRHELAAAAPVDAGFLVGLGLLTMTGTGVAGLLLRGEVLGSGTYHGHLPLVGDFHAASPVLFDTGVYLLVLGVVLDVLRSLGSGIDRRVERDMRDGGSSGGGVGGEGRGGKDAGARGKART